MFFKRNKYIRKPEAPHVQDVPHNPERLQGLTFHYLQLYINGLNRSYRFMLMEECKDGTLITHKQDASWEEMRDYVRLIWSPARPQKFIIHAI